MNELAPNYYAFCEAILAPEEEFVDGILYKYGLLDLESKDLKKLELDEMMELYFKENWTYKRIAEKFGLSDSGVYRKIKRGAKRKNA